MVGESGEIMESRRNYIRIHGGRQNNKKELRPTRGCIRVYDEDIKRIKEKTEAFGKDDLPQTVTVTEDPIPEELLIKFQKQ